jgi:hypothetical protein
LTPFNAWAGAGAFWTGLLREFTHYPQDLPPDVSPRQMRSEQVGYALMNMPSLDLPSLRLLAPLLLVYILVVGPLNYLVLRWQRRLELGWVTIPAITLLFSIGAYGIGYQLRGGDVIINQISTIELRPGNPVGTSSVRSFVGIFSPARREYNLELPGDLLVSPLTSQGGPWFGSDPTGSAGQKLLISQGQPTMLRGLSINQWSMQSFVLESVEPATTTAVEAELSLQGERISGTIVNRSSYAWRDVVIAQGTQFQRLGDLEPGERAEIDLPLTSLIRDGSLGSLGWRLFEDRLNAPRGPARDAQVKQQILDSIFNGPFGPETGLANDSDGPVLIAWADTPPLTVTLPGYRVTPLSTTLVHGRLPLSFAENEVVLPAGLLQPQIEADGNRYLCYSPRGPGIAPDFDEMTISFRLPSELSNLRVEALDLHITSDGGWFSPPQVMLWAWDQNAWVSAGDNLEIGKNTIAEPARFVRDGAIRVQARNETRDRGGCIYFDIGIKGQRG